MIRQISFKYELLSSSMSHKKWLYTVKDCSIQWQSLTQLKSSASLTMRDDKDVDYINDRIRIYAKVNGVESILGTFLLCASDAKENEYKAIERSCECYSLLKLLLDSTTEQTYQAATGTNVVNEVIRLIGDLGEYEITPSDKTLITNKPYPPGTSYLDIINDLLDVINYTPLYCDKSGKFISKPYVLPEDRQIEFTWLEDINGLIKPNKTRSMDLFEVPNVFTAVTNSIDINPPLTYTYVNSNPESRTSTVSRNRRINKTENVDTTSYADLITKAKAMCVEANSVFEHIEFEKSLVTDLDFYMPCGFIIDGKYIVYNISYKCEIGNDMKIKARKAVELID